MKGHFLAAFSLLLLLALPLASAEQACLITLGGGDYLCKSEGSYTGSTPWQHQCTNENGVVVQNAGSDPRCLLKCCCVAGANAALFEDPVSQYFCEQQEESAPYPDDGTGQVLPNQDCDAACGAGAGTTGGVTYSVSGTVYDDGADPVVPLAAARIEYPADSILLTTYSDDDGRFSFAGVPAATKTFKASKAGCGEEQLVKDVQGMVTDLDFHLDCTAGSCSLAAITDTAAAAVQGQAKATITWSATTCGEALGYRVSRCEDDGNHACVAGSEVAIANLPPEAESVTDPSVPAGHAFCYAVTIIDRDGNPFPQGVTGGAHCLPAMDEACTDGRVGASPECANDDPALKPLGNPDASDGRYSSFTGGLRCDETNRLIAVGEPCEEGEYCVLSTGATPTCVASSQCDLCNGAFGWFVDATARVIPGRATTCANLLGCLLDNNGYATDTFRSCAAITSCYDYGSESACETASGADRCRVSASGCAWEALPGLEELGRGICLPKAAAEQECAACGELFGGLCDKDRCELFGTEQHPCYFNVYAVAAGEEEGCRSAEEMACRYYDTQEDCIGRNAVPPGKATVDVTYDDPADPDGVRKSGSNKVTVEAGLDVMGFRRCAWFAEEEADSGDGGYCIKEANGRILEDSLWIESRLDDCDESGLLSGAELAACYKDNEAPVTELPFTEGQFIDANALRTAAPVVRDGERYLDQALFSRFCLAASGESCYPDRALGLLLPEEQGVGAYTLHYYSFDEAENLEEVGSLSLNIDRDSGAYLVNATLVS